MSRHNSSNVFRIQPITVKRAKTIRAHQENARNTSCFMSKALWMDGWKRNRAFSDL